MYKHPKILLGNSTKVHISVFQLGLGILCGDTNYVSPLPSTELFDLCYWINSCFLKNKILKNIKEVTGTMFA